MRVLLLSSLHPRRAAQQILDAGGGGVASKSDEESALLHTVRKTVAGRQPVMDSAASALSPEANAPRLSSQETQVLALYAVELPIDEVGVRRQPDRLTRGPRGPPRVLPVTA